MPIAYWEGGSVAELSREELIEAVTELGAEVLRLQAEAHHRREHLFDRCQEPGCRSLLDSGPMIGSMSPDTVGDIGDAALSEQLLQDSVGRLVGKTIDAVDASACNNVVLSFTDGSKVALHIEVDSLGLPEVSTCIDCAGDDFHPTVA